MSKQDDLKATIEALKAVSKARYLKIVILEAALRELIESPVGSARYVVAVREARAALAGETTDD